VTGHARLPILPDAGYLGDLSSFLQARTAFVTSELREE
jgi:hypothetical protein